MNKKEISKYMSKLGKLSAKKSPRPKEYYKAIGDKGRKTQALLRKKLSPPIA